MISHVWWLTPVVPATPQGEAERLLDPKSLRPGWATYPISKKKRKYTFSITS
jgi:hypothetical protein